MLNSHKTIKYIRPIVLLINDSGHVYSKQTTISGFSLSKAVGMYETFCSEFGLCTGKNRYDNVHSIRLVYNLPPDTATTTYRPFAPYLSIYYGIREMSHGKFDGHVIGKTFNPILGSFQHHIAPHTISISHSVHGTRIAYDFPMPKRDGKETEYLEEKINYAKNPALSSLVLNKVLPNLNQFTTHPLGYLDGHSYRAKLGQGTLHFHY